MIQTVLGPITADALGKTLIHEHVLIGYPGWFMDVRMPPFIREEALDRVVDAFQALHAYGVRTVVDPCPMDLGRDVGFLAEVSQRSGINLICTTGAYTEAEGIPFTLGHLEVEAIADILQPRRLVEQSQHERCVVRAKRSQHNSPRMQFLDGLRRHDHSGNRRQHNPEAAQRLWNPPCIPPHPADLARTGIHDGLDVGHQAHGTHLRERADARRRECLAQARRGGHQGSTAADEIVDQQDVVGDRVRRLHGQRPVLVLRGRAAARRGP